MSVIEIVGGAILLVASLVIVFLTLMQHTHGQGLSGAINGSVGGANNARLTPADQMLAKVTRIAGVVFFCGRYSGLSVRRPSGRLRRRCSPVNGRGCFLCRKKCGQPVLRAAAKRGQGKRPSQQGRAPQEMHGHGSEGENILWQCAIKLSTRSRISRAP